MDYFANTEGLPRVVGLVVIALESFGAIALMAGIGTRLIAGSYVVLAAGIALKVHAQNGFFMNWFGNQSGEGFEFFLLWIGMAISLAISGGGKYSIDNGLIMKNAHA
jgi:putative oxidoreductase